MKYRAFGTNLPEIKIDADTAEQALANAKQINAGYIGITPIVETSQARYSKKNIRQFIIRLNYNTDTEVLEMLENEPNKQGLIKRLLYEEYERRNS